MRITLLFAILAACSSSSTPVAAPPPPAPAPVAPVAAPDPYASLNLGFEVTANDRPTGWWIVVKDYEMHAVPDVHRTGERSLRLRSTGKGNFAAVGASLDAKPLAGKRLRIHGWVKTADVTGGAGLWLRIDGGGGALDNMDGRRRTGTTDWTEVVAEVQVPAGAESAVFGPMLVGDGTAWFDDLRIEVTGDEKPVAIVLEGTVVDAAGAPVAGAEVALVAVDLAQHVKTDAKGRFHFDATSGRWGFSAHRKGAVGGFLDQQPFAADARDVKIALAKDGGVTVRGRTRPAAAPGTYLGIAPVSQHNADLFAVPVAADGTFEAVLPRGDEYTVGVVGVGGGGRSFARKGDVVEVDLPVLAPGPPPAEVVDYIATQGIPLATPEAGNGFADMERIGALVGNARVVALGEATHGTREFFQLKHRFLEYLVAKHGFTVFAIEANQPECRAINDYVVNGKGNARDALAGIYFWTWNTEEVLAMIEWMRAWNADPKHTAKVQFTGYDMQTSVVAFETVAAFLRARTADKAAALIAPVAALGDKDAPMAIGKLPYDARAKMAAGLTAIAKAFDANKRTWKAPDYADARHDVTVLEQALRLYSASGIGGGGFEERDLAMADNIGWLMEQQPRARLVVWAHNGHIANTLGAIANMGSHLRKRLGKAYVNLGFVFGEGGFQAKDMTTGKIGELKDFTVGPPPESNASVAFSRTGKPLLVLDLRALPARGTVRDWFAGPHPVRDIGAAFASERSMTQLHVLPDLYDAVIFVDKTTRARPVKKS